MVSFIDANGQRQQIDLNGMALYREAMSKKLTLRQLINQKYPTSADQPETFKQFCVTAGLRFKADDHTGIPAASLMEVFDPYTPDATSSITSNPAAPDSRILFPAAIMELVEDKLVNDTNSAISAFEGMIGYRQTVASNRVEQPVISYSGNKGPEEAQFQRIAQGAAPPIMLSITASDISRRIPTMSIGMEITMEALQSNSLDIISLSLARFYSTAYYSMWTEQLGYILAGDSDAAVTPMSSATSALAQVKADVYDSTIAANGTLTQLAWLQYLYHNSMKMQKTHIVTDMAGAIAMDVRTNRPTNVQNDSTDRLDVPFRVVYPNFQSNINVVVMPAGTWSANTIMGLDSRWAMYKINSSLAEYEAVESVVMRKTQQFRYDTGFITGRLFDDAYDVLSLTYT